MCGICLFSAVMQTTKQVMEQGLADGIYIDYWQEEDKFQCIRTAIITEICDQVSVNSFEFYLKM